MGVPGSICVGVPLKPELGGKGLFVSVMVLLLLLSR